MSNVFFNFKWLVILLLINTSSAQNDSVKDWINKNGLVIDRTNFELDTVFFKNNLKKEFSKVKIFGFGEASHQHKEFFELKTSFFKHLVTNCNVKYFFLEESYGAAYQVNRYVNGQEDDLKKIILNFRQSIWKTQEMYSLIIWIKQYNLNKQEEDKIKFYGIDTMFNYNISEIIRQELKVSGVILSEKISNILDSLSIEVNVPHEDKVKGMVKENEIMTLKEFIEGCEILKDKRHSLDYAINRLIQQNNFLIHPIQDDRDKYMAENIEFFVKRNITDANFFVWAHNEHVKKTKLIHSNTLTMGNWLTKKFGDLYYSVGFNFGVGSCKGMDKDGVWNILEINEPIKKTFSEALYEVNHDIFFLDFKNAVKNDSMNSFLNSKIDQIVIGGYGLTTKNIKYIFVKEKPIDAFDGFVFVKKVSLSTPLN